MVSEWHAEQVTMAKINGQNCVTSVFDETMDVTTGTRTGSIHVSHPAKIVSVQTVDVQLNIHPDTAPEEPGDNPICVGYVAKVFDSWKANGNDDKENRQEHD
jgi:hypothetical protein